MTCIRDGSWRKSLVILISFFAIALMAAANAQATGRAAPEGVMAPIESPTAGSTSGRPTLPYGAATMDQSAFAMGTMQWNVIFVENDGSVANRREFWTSSERDNIRSRISESERYWEGLTSNLNPACRLSINVNYINDGNPLTVPYEPSSDQSENWMNSAMAKLGSYNSSDRFTNVRNFNQDTRLAAGVNWSTTLFLIDNTTYERTSYAYAYWGGPFAVLENNPAGWGPENFNMILAHEMGHIFFAHDEYAGSGRTTAEYGGYLNVANSNASLDGNHRPVNPPQPNALMLNSGDSIKNASHLVDGTYAPSLPSREMVGLRDTDADGIPDILDTPPIVTGNTEGSDPNAGLFLFSGVVQVSTLVNLNPLSKGFSNSNNGMTINTISSAYYVLDGGIPMLLSAQDGAFDGYTESIRLTLDGLAFGQHSIDLYGVNNVGNPSNTMHFSLNVVPEPSSIALLMASGLVFLTFRYSNRSHPGK
jgi:hypothetical protein